jgi:hypothetical protein
MSILADPLSLHRFPLLVVPRNVHADVGEGDCKH